MKKEKQEDKVIEKLVDFEAVLNNSKSYLESLDIVTKVIEETILEKGADRLFNKYLAPKIRPFAVYDTILLAEQQVNVCKLSLCIKFEV